MGPDEANDIAQPGSGWRRWLVRALLVLLALILSGLAYVWTTRDRIAGDLIDDALAESGVEARYDIASIGPRRQIIENVVIGDPAAPDLTIGRVVAVVGYGFGAPSIDRIELTNPRLFGSLRGGKLSFGALDPLIFAESEEPQALPSIDVTIAGGGARIETDYGPVGAFFEGAGRIDDGFAGKLAVTAPGAGVEGCSAAVATAYGEVAMEDGAPRFTGPVRLRQVACNGASVDRIDIAAQLGADANLAKLDASLDVMARGLGSGGGSARQLSGTARLSLGSDALVLEHDLTARGVATDYARFGSLGADGSLRSARGLTQSSWNAQITGGGVAIGTGAQEALADARAAGAGTLAEALLAKLERNLVPATRAAELEGSVVWRQSDTAQSIVIPEARLYSTEGETLLALSRLSWRPGIKGSGDGALSGNFLTGGAGLPQITGRIEQPAPGRLELRMAMEEYRAGDDSIALPRLVVRQTRGDRFVFAGEARASGRIPGGSVRSLRVPLNGTYAPASGLEVGTRCERIEYAQLAAYNLDLAGGALDLCPPAGRAMLRYGPTLDAAVVAQDPLLVGSLAQSPARLSATRAEFTFPGGFALEDLAATLGPEGNAVSLASQRLTGTIGEELSGTIAQGTAKLESVPLDLGSLAGEWRYDGSVLTIADAGFVLTERTDGRPRFEPLRSEGAVLTLADNIISARAGLDHAEAGQRITNVRITHDLQTGSGSAILAVPGVTFGPKLALDDLSYLAKGVIAYTEGTVAGEGRIAWNNEDITSSGVFRTQDLNLAAAFGPVRHLRGEVRFADLLALTTEPSQVLEIGSINPGIEALDGRVRYALVEGTNIVIEDARWPFMGGELVMRPTTLRYGTEAEQRYTFEITALDAARFVAQMELSNIGATGTFDGIVPIIFDANGDGRIEDGRLGSRPPGGNISYIGELTYEDMGAMANFAFQALRSLNYRRMEVDLDGDLAGEIITRFRIDGVRQGEDASRNFITERLARLPIRFIVNVRSENFYELATMVRTFWDPEALPGAGDVLEREIGARGAPAEPQPEPPPGPNAADIPATRRDEPAVQPPESENPS
jgi:hypothetical protein